MLNSHLANCFNIVMEKKKSVPVFLSVVSQFFEVYATQTLQVGTPDNTGTEI